MRRSRRVFALAALAGGLFAAFGSSEGRAQGVPDIRLAGSSTIAPVMLEIGKLYEAGEGKARIFVETGGSSKGIADLRRGLTDIAMVSRELKPSEADLTAHVIARDGIAALIHAENPVQEISRADLRAIFTGELTNWSQAGGPDREIIVVSKGEGSATSVVLNTFLGVTADQIQGDLVAAENAQMIKTVSLTPDSIGYVSIGAAMVDIGFGVPVKLIALGDVPATLENVGDGSYKATRPLNLVTTGAEAVELQELVGFSKSEAVGDIIRDLSYTPASQ
ncbi:phosphate ABC transporter substrate-binding protein [Cribrihabitans neustonicus]|uniref:phosphate ABC transporter substrate-binding protein n=1 Tax=Cribrihabitans neustonicus TaxID=1429085 RepID=UPI003B58E902